MESRQRILVEVGFNRAVELHSTSFEAADRHSFLSLANSLNAIGPGHWVLALVTGVGTIRGQEVSQADFGEITNPSFAVQEPVRELSQVDLRLLAGFFLLLGKWDTLQSTQAPVESPDKRESA